MFDLALQRRTRLIAGLSHADFDVLLSGSTSTVTYATGFRSLAAALYEDVSPIVVVGEHGVRLVIPYSQAAAAIDQGVAPEEIIAFGEFHFDTKEPNKDPFAVERRECIVTAIQTALKWFGHGQIGLEIGSLPDVAIQWLINGGLSGQVDAKDWASTIRAVKLPEEIQSLERAAQITEDAIDAALSEARAGISEWDLARMMAEYMLAHGAEPEFFSVQIGERSALGDAFPGSRQWSFGEVLKLDLGCRVDGYWSDLGRTAVLGEPNNEVAIRYAALAAGVQAQLASIKPGIDTRTLFDVALGTVRSSGLPTYDRNHCGHGIGLAIYDPPLIQKTNPVIIEEGMVLCLETPYYQHTVGGMIIEEAVVITSDGYRALSISGPKLRVIKP